MGRSLRRAKTFALTLVLALLVPILAACAGNATTPTTSAPAAGGASPSAAAATSPSAAAEASPSVAAEASPSVATSPSPEATGTAAGAAAESPINEKTFVAAFNQAPDTLFDLESQSSVTSQVLAPTTGFCVNQLTYEYQPTYCFDEFPTFENGGAVTETVTIDPERVSEETPIVVEGQVVTDTATAEAAGITIPVELPQLTLTFNLNPQLRWEDGEPVTSADAEEAFRVQRDPELQVATRYLIERIVDVEGTDDTTVVQTYAPGYLESDYYTTFIGLVPEHQYGGQSIAEIRDQESVHPFSFGPYMVQEHVPGEQTSFVSNPYFPTQPKIGTVIFRYVSDADQLLAQLESGTIDYAGTIGLGLNQTEQLDALAQGNQAEVQYVPATVWEHIDFGIRRGDNQESFFDDVRVRQAVAYAVNRQEIIDQVLFGKTTVMNTYVPQDHPSHPESGLEEYAHDPEQARQLLDQAGWTAGANGTRTKGGREFTVTMYTTQGNRLREAASLIIQQNLKDVGINLQLEFVPGPEVLFKSGAEGILAGRRFDMALYAWVSGVDPSHTLYLCDEIPTAENGYAGQNNPGYCNPEFDRAARQALNELDRERKRELDQAPELMYNQELPSFPLYQRLNVAAFNPAVTGIKIDPTSTIDLYNLEQIDIEQQ